MTDSNKLHNHFARMYAQQDHHKSSSSQVLNSEFTNNLAFFQSILIPVAM